MTQRTARRNFLAGSIAALAATACRDQESATAADDDSSVQEFYELRQYLCDSTDKRDMVSGHLAAALVPALRRQGIKHIGGFTPVEGGMNNVYLLIAYPTLDALGSRNAALAADSTYQTASAEFFAISKDNAPYTRIESRLMKAFAGMPRIVPPVRSDAASERLVELRIYESHNEDKARLKVEMFNEGEIDIMRDVQLGPVFFGETLIAGDVPNLTYMLSADSPAAHEEHWKGFRVHPEWNRMKNLDKYRDTVSRITSVTLKPMGWSDI